MTAQERRALFAKADLCVAAARAFLPARVSESQVEDLALWLMDFDEERIKWWAGWVDLPSEGDA